MSKRIYPAVGKAASGRTPTSLRIALHGLFIPAMCAVCGENHTSFGICENCSEALDEALSPQARFVITAANSFKMECAAVFSYKNDAVKRLLFYLKAHTNRYAVGYGAIRLLGVMHTFDLQGTTLLVNVPRSARGKKDFGFDQSELLARRIAKILRKSGEPVRFAPLLKRTRRTTPQKELSAAERAVSQRGAFRVNRFSARFYGAPDNIVLIDDVITTGSSLGECAATLSRLYPHAKLYGAALAKTEFSTAQPSGNFAKTSSNGTPFSRCSFSNQNQVLWRHLSPKER